MKYALRIISLISYSIIIIFDQKIGVPLFLWITFHLLNPGSLDQLFAISGFIGIILNGTKWIHKLSGNIISFLLLLVPLISRVIQGPMEQFKYLAFTIPFSVFIINYLIIIANAYKKTNREQIG